MKQYIDISDFKNDNSFYEELNFVTAVKSFDLGEIRKRYLDSTKNKKIGSFKRREVGVGGLVSYKIENGNILTEKIVLETKEPRAIDIFGDKLAFASENKVFVVENEQVFELQDSWFSYVHTIEFSKTKEDIVLISSSGYDCFFEYNYKTGEKIFEWFAWENGYNTGVDDNGDKLILTRNENEFEQLTSKGENVLLVDPTKGTLPTAQRAAFINSVSYSESEKGYLATFFHRGEVRRIEESTDQVIFDGLQSPHGGKEINGEYVATDTRGGRVLLKTNEREIEIDFKSLRGKPDYLLEKEWLQNSAYNADFIITIDSNRTSFVIFSLEKKMYSVIPYNNEFAVQDIVFGNVDSQTEILKTIL